MPTPHRKTTANEGSADDQVLRSVLTRVQATLDQNPDAFRPANSSRLKLWLWRFAVFTLVLGCLAVWFLIPALRS